MENQSKEKRVKITSGVRARMREKYQFTTFQQSNEWTKDKRNAQKNICDAYTYILIINDNDLADIINDHRFP